MEIGFLLQAMSSLETEWHS